MWCLFRYFNAREQYIIPEEEKKLESLKKEVEKLREEQRVLEDELMKEVSNLYINSFDTLYVNVFNK